MLLAAVPALLVGIPVAVAGSLTTAGSESGGTAQRAARCDGTKPTIKGTRRDDRGRRKLRGTRGDDVISTGRGDDVVVASGGDDLICGGRDDDKLKGGAGDDRLFGSGGNDKLNGGPDTDVCDGGPGRNRAKNCEDDSPPPPPGPGLPPDPAVANPDSFNVIGNTGLFVGTTRTAGQAGRQISGSLLANDTPSGSLVAEPVSNAPTAQGGTITIEPDGNFTYHPQAGDTGITDSFIYRVCKSSPCNASDPASATGALSLPIAGQVWYVRNNSPAGGDGTSDGPFDTLAEAEAASGSGDTTYVFDGDNTSTDLQTGYATNASERLLGQAGPLSVDPDAGGPLGSQALFPGTPGARPSLTATNEDVVTLASGSRVEQFNINPVGTGGGVSASAVSSVTVAQIAIQGSTGPGINLTNVGGGVNLSGVTVDGGATDGIRASAVNGLTLANSTVTGNGNALGEHGIDANGLTGTVTLEDDEVTGNAEHNVSITNDAGTLDATIDGGTIGDNSSSIGEDGVTLSGTGTGSMSLQVLGTAFTDNRGDHIQMSTDASNTVSQDVTVANTTMNTTAAADPNVLGGGITVNPGGNATADVTITNNDIQQAFGSAIVVDTQGSAAAAQPAQVDATISSNTIGTAATAGSGSESGDGIFLSSNGMADVDALVTGNAIRQYNVFGIEAVQNDGNGNLDLTATDNVISNPGTFAANGIQARSGLTSSTDSGVSCFDIGHSTNDSQMNTVVGSGGVGSDDIRVRQLGQTTFRMPGYSAPANDNVAVVSFLQTRNNPNPPGGVPTASATNSGAGGGFTNTTGGVPCPQP